MKMFYSYCLFAMFVLPSFCAAQQSKIDSLQDIISQNNRDTIMANALYNLANEYMRKDNDLSKKYSWQTKALSKEIGSNPNLASSYSILVNIHRNEATLDSVDFYLDALKKLATSSNRNDFDGVNSTYYSTVGLNLRRNGKSKEALPYLLKAYDYAIKLKNTTDASGQAINIGNSYSEVGDVSKSLEYYVLALKGFERVGHKPGQAFCYNNISSAYYKLNRLQESLVYIKKSRLLKEEMGDKKGIANVEQNMGNIYLGLDDIDTAESHFHKAIAINAEFKNNTGLMENYYNLARLKRSMDPKAALVYFEKSKKCALAAKDTAMISKIDLELMAVKKALNEKELTSESEAISNLQILKTAGNKYQEAFGYQNMADYYSKNNEFEKALDYSNKFHEMKDSLNNNEVQVKFKTIEEQYNKEKNEKQIVILQKDKEISSQKLNQQRTWIIVFGLIILFFIMGIWMLIYRNKIKQQLKEVNLLNQIAADLHDEVGSSLSSIYMLSQMAGQDNFVNKQNILKKVSTNAYETMDKMSDIVWMIKPKEDTGVKERMERFVHDLCESRNLSCSFSANALDHLKFSMNQHKNLYLIFKEAVNNAIKYANATALTITMVVENKKLFMHIEDNGIGFNENIMSQGNGLDNMKSRAKELKGELKIVSGPDIGTKIDLSFPLA